MRPLLALALCLALTAPAAAKDLPAKPAPAKADAAKPLGPKKAEAGVADRLAEIRRLALAGKEDMAYEALAGLVDAPDFDTLAEVQRYEARSAAGSLAWRSHEHARALTHLRLATEYAQARAHDWESRAWLEVITDDRNAAATSLVELLRRAPERAPDLDGQLLWGALAADHASPGRLALLRTLFELDYAPRHTGDASELWRYLAELQVARGETDAARAALARIGTASSLVKVLADRRYDALIDRDAPQFDLARAGQARVADLRARAILAPDVLETQVELVAALLSIGEDADALALVDEIVANATAADAGQHPGYRDTNEQLPWAYNYAATALVRLGRHDDAVDYLRRGTGMDESGVPNVSQTLNLGQLYNNLGRHEEALETVENVVANMSTIGHMVQANARLRAALDTGDREGADAAMAFVRANRDESPGILLESLVEAGDLDEAAAEVIAMLESPEDRADALDMLQPYAEGPALPGEKRYNDNWRRLENRADVKAAVERVGRILPPLPVHGTL